MLSPDLIDKLGHTIDEIRHRALRSVRSKYKLDLVDKMNVENNAMIFAKLLNWFDFGGCVVGHNQDVFDVLTEVCRSDSFSNVASGIGPENILKKLSYIEKTVDPKYQAPISEIKDAVLRVARKMDKSVTSHLSLAKIDSRSYTSYDVTETTQVVGTASSNKPKYLPWIKLTPSDKRLLKVMYQSLRYIDDSSSILEACQFFKDVILHDYPAEIFLQRPLIINTLFELMKSVSLLIRITILKSLNDLLLRLTRRIAMLHGNSMRGRNRIKDIKEDVEDDGGDVQKYQMTHDEFLAKMIKLSLSCLSHCDTSGDVNSTCEEYILSLDILIKSTRLFKMQNYNISFIADFEKAITFKRINERRFSSMILLTSAIDMDGIRQEKYWHTTDPMVLLFFPKLQKLYKQKNVKFDNLELVTAICKAMESSSDLLNQYEESKAPNKYFDLVEKSLSSLEFHKCTRFFNKFLTLCQFRHLSEEEKQKRNKLILKLIKFPEKTVQEEFFIALENLVSKLNLAKKPKTNSGDDLTFLFDTEIFKEFLIYGLNMKDRKMSDVIQNLILNLLLSKQHLSKPVWEMSIPSLEQSFSYIPLLIGLKSAVSPLFVHMLKQSVAKELDFNEVSSFIGNLRLLFSNDVAYSDEAFLEVCGFLNKDNTRTMKFPRTIPFNCFRSTQGVKFFIIPKQELKYPCGNKADVSELLMLLEILRDKESNLQLQQSALLNLSVVLTDPLLHCSFVENDGVTLVLDILESSLFSVRSSSESIYPIIILNTLCITTPRLRSFIISDFNILMNICRCLFLFIGQEIGLRHCVVLLFLIIFDVHITQKTIEYSRMVNITLPSIMKDRFYVPFEVNFEDKPSLQCMPSLRVEIMGNPYCAKFLRIYWTSLWLGDVDAVLELQAEDLKNDIYSPNIPEDMKLTLDDHASLKDIALMHLMKTQLMALKSPGNHFEAIYRIQNLRICLSWMKQYQSLSATEESLLKLRCDSYENLNNFGWDDVLIVYLHTLPACLNDVLFLIELLTLLRELHIFLPSLEEKLSDIITNPNCVFYALMKKVGNEEYGVPGRELKEAAMQLIQDVLLKRSKKERPDLWKIYIQLILDLLDQNIGDRLNSLAQLDWMMILLSNLTGSWTWDYGYHIELYECLLTRVIQVLLIFNSAADVYDSFMAINVIRHAVIIINNLLADGLKSTQNLDKQLISAFREGDNSNWMTPLMSHHDPVIRASSLNIIAMLLSNTKLGSLNMYIGITELTSWCYGIELLQDKLECSLVRDKAALLLSNLCLRRKNCHAEFLSHVKFGNIFETLGDILRMDEDSDDFSKPRLTPQLASSSCNLLLALMELEKDLVLLQMSQLKILISLFRLMEHFEPSALVFFHSSAKLIRTCIKISPDFNLLLLRSTHCLRILCSILDITYFDDNELPTIAENSWTEIILLLATVLENPTDGSLALKDALSTKNPKTFTHSIYKALSSPCAPLRASALQLISNLATDELLFLFDVNITTTETFATLIAEKLCRMDLKDVTKALSALLRISSKARQFAVDNNLAKCIVVALQAVYDGLYPYQNDNFHKKKKAVKHLENFESLLRLTTNFCYQNAAGRRALAVAELPRIVNKLWHWCGIRPSISSTVLKMLCTFTYKSERACQSSALLIHPLTSLVDMEMDVINKTRDLSILSVTFQVLCNFCDAVECRVILAKSKVLIPITKILKAQGRKANYTEQVLEMWLHFLNVFTAYSEGQTSVCTNVDAIQFIYLTAMGPSGLIKSMALCTLLHLALNPQNRVRLISTPTVLLQILENNLRCGEQSDVVLVATTLWALSANSQKGKAIFRNAGFESLIQDASQRFKAEDECQKYLKKALKLLTKN